jgi:hypothetical protein
VHFATRQLSGATNSSSKAFIDGVVASRARLSPDAAAAADAALQAVLELAEASRRQQLNQALQPSLKRQLQQCVAQEQQLLQPLDVAQELGPPTPGGDGGNAAAEESVLELAASATAVLMEQAKRLLDGLHAELGGSADQLLLLKALQVRGVSHMAWFMDRVKWA